MTRKILVFVILIGFAFSCSNSTKSEKDILLDSISNLEKDCFDNINNTYNHKVALKTLVMYQKFINKYPSDSLTAHYLYTSAQLSKSINLYGEAIRKYELYIKQYPKTKEAAKSNFMVGMIYENDLKDTVNAKKAYQNFIKNYPNNDLVDDAEFLIQNLSLTNEELIQMLEAKSKLSEK